MSEREVRKYARHTEDCCVVSYLGAKALVPCDCGYLDAMKEPLDLQRLVEWLKRERQFFDATSAPALFYDHVLKHIADELGGKDGG